MKIVKSILGIIGFMIFLMGIIYGDITGAYLSSAAIFLIIYAFNIINIISKKLKIKLNLPSELLLIGSVVFIYLSLFESNLKIYNLIMAVSCTILSWLFIIYINIPQNNKNKKKK